jgi:(p)ppGpp synthase/HD superfamily hydrolase
MVNEIAYNKAKLLAERIHLLQTRAGTGIPYVTHPITVSEILIKYGRSEEEVIAGVLHDVVEDIDGTEEAENLKREIARDFGNTVLSIVLGATKISKKEDGNRLARVKIDIYHYVMGSAGVHNVKIADTMHNLSDLSTLDPTFAKKYLREKEWLVAEFAKNGKADKQMLADLQMQIEVLKSQFQ